MGFFFGGSPFKVRQREVLAGREGLHGELFIDCRTCAELRRRSMRCRTPFDSPGMRSEYTFTTACCGRTKPVKVVKPVMPEARTAGSVAR